LYLSGGTYQHSAYGHTWLKSSRAVAVGMLQMDKRIRSNDIIRPDIHAKIESRLNAGKRMAVLFGPSDLEPIWARFVEFAIELFETLSGREEWFVVVKPKSSNTAYQHLPDLDKYPNVICVRYDSPGAEVCSSGYLISKSDLILTTPGSVTIEALTQQRLCFSFFPVLQFTTLWNTLQDGGLAFQTKEEMGGGISEYMRSGNTSAAPLFQWISNEFDPFRDDQALRRVVAALCNSQDIATARAD